MGLPGENRYFTAREGTLKQLRRLLTSRDPDAKIQALIGMGGVGKTQIALRYSHRFYRKYQYVFWTDAGTEAEMLIGYAAFAQRLGLTSEAEKNIKVVKQKIEDWLQDHEDWLLVFNNADDLAFVKAFLPAHPRGHVLITTRHWDFSSIVQRIDISTLSEAEGAVLLLRCAHPDSVKNAALAEKHPEWQGARRFSSVRVGGLPLALEQAGSYINKQQCSVADYCKIYDDEAKKLAAHYGDYSHSIHASVITTYSASFKKVQDNNEAAGDLLHLCAFLAPDNIPEAVTTQGGPHLSGSPLELFAGDRQSWLEARRHACEYFLLTLDRETQSLSIHRVVQEVIRWLMDQELRQVWMERAVRSVQGAFPTIEFRNRSLCEHIVPHAQECALHIFSGGLSFLEAGILLHETAYYLSERGQYSEAEPLYDRAAMILKAAPCSDPSWLPRCLNNMAWLYYKTDRYDEARPCYLAALRSLRQATPRDRHEIAWASHTRAAVCRELEDFLRSERLYRYALAIFNNTGNPNLKNAASVLDGLGELSRRKSELKEAGKFFLGALDIRHGLVLKSPEVMGEDHPDFVPSFKGLAQVHHAQGFHSSADHFYGQAIIILERAFGKKHPEILELEAMRNKLPQPL